MHGQSGIYCKKKVYSENTPYGWKNSGIMIPLLVILANLESVLKVFAQNKKYLPRIPPRWL